MGFTVQANPTNIDYIVNSAVTVGCPRRGALFSALTVEHQLLHRGSFHGSQFEPHECLLISPLAHLLRSAHFAIHPVHSLLYCKRPRSAYNAMLSFVRDVRLHVLGTSLAFALPP